MAGKRRKFDAEFREGAVRTVAEAGKPIAQVAEDLGTNETTLASWVLRARRAGGATATGESEELVRLRRASGTFSRPWTPAYADYCASASNHPCPPTASRRPSTCFGCSPTAST
ncbi:transposase [Streptomyces sp. NPDC101152]|uniref:transposase n=1 Tax=Streptomyces sp. NPDC101152 TaxID=3366116 RepID=UPI0038051A69